MSEYGGDRYASSEYAGADEDGIEEVGTLSVDSPTGAVHDNPFRVSWVLTTNTGDPQLEYRVLVESYSNGRIYDSGWVKSPNSWADIDLVKAGFGGEDKVGVTVAAHNRSRGYAGFGELDVALQLGQPVVTFLQPDPVSESYPNPLLLCQWDYEDTRSRPQAQSRVRLWLGEQQLYDSGWVSNLVPTWTVPYLLFTGSRYTVGLTVRNDLGVGSVGVI